MKNKDGRRAHKLAVASFDVKPAVEVRKFTSVLIKITINFGSTYVNCIIQKNQNSNKP